MISPKMHYMLLNVRLYTVKKTKIGRSPHTKRPGTSSRGGSFSSRKPARHSGRGGSSGRGGPSGSNTTTRRRSPSTPGRDFRGSGNSGNSGGRDYKRNGAGRRDYGRSSGGGRSMSGGHKRNDGGRGRGGGGGFSRNRGGGGRRMPTFNPTDFINETPKKVQEVEKYVAKNTFKTLGLDTRLVKTIGTLKMLVPTPIQDQIIPHILKNKDVIALAETGTGKTAAFLIPLIEKTIQNIEHKTLVLVPTRELAVQVTRELFLLTKDLGMQSVTCVGGMDIRPQIKKLSRSHQFVIATPGRALDLIKKRFIIAENFKTVVLDEADRMLDMGFIGDMRKILEKTPEDRETLFFSATMDKAAEKLSDDFLRNPVTVSVKKRDVTSNIEQSVVHYNQNNKFETLLELLDGKEFKRVLIFGSMKHSAQKLAEQLNFNNVPAESIHGNKSHGHRQRALKNFRDGTYKVIVATDVVARGIHVDAISHVINYDLPNTFEDYVHRIGRTGRADQKGKAITFVLGRD